jgi:hypothetical protein
MLQKMTSVMWRIYAQQECMRMGISCVFGAKDITLALNSNQNTGGVLNSLANGKTYIAMS